MIELLESDESIVAAQPKILAYNNKEYFEHASYIAKGDYDTSNSFTAKANCYNMPISSLDAALPVSFRTKTVLHAG